MTANTCSKPAAFAKLRASMASLRLRFRRLSPKETTEKRAQGECYFCPEKYTNDHKCLSKGDEDAATGDITEHEISLAALRLQEGCFFLHA